MNTGNDRKISQNRSFLHNGGFAKKKSRFCVKKFKNSKLLSKSENIASSKSWLKFWEFLL